MLRHVNEVCRMCATVLIAVLCIQLCFSQEDTQETLESGHGNPEASDVSQQEVEVFAPIPLHKGVVCKLRGATEVPPSEAGYVALIVFDDDYSSAEFHKLVDEALLGVNLGGERRSYDEVVVSVTSSGGEISEHGMYFAAMERLRKAYENLTVCVDEYAHSGGAMMCMPAKKLYVSRFAEFGSFGVVYTFQANLKRREKFHIQSFSTAPLKGPFDTSQDPDQKQIARIKEHIKECEKECRSMLLKYQPQCEPHLDEIFSGAFWIGAEMVRKDIGLINEIGPSSHEYLFDLNRTHNIWQIEMVLPSTQES